MANAQEQAVEQPPSINPIQNAFVPIATSAFGFLGSSGDTLGELDADGAFAYLDGNSAGLGVCKVVTASRQCNPSSDDNTQLGEVLGLTWMKDMRISSLSFRGENHPNDSFDASDFFDVSFDSGASWSTFSLINAKVSPVFMNATVKKGDYLLLTTSAPGNEQFYLSAAEVAPVPLPASIVLLAGAFGGLGALARRRAARAS